MGLVLLVVSGRAAIVVMRNLKDCRWPTIDDPRSLLATLMVILGRSLACEMVIAAVELFFAIAIGWQRMGATGSA